MTEGRGGTFGGLHSILEKYDEETVRLKSTFNRNTIFLLGKPLLVPQRKLVTIAMSSENLLLNAYRQSRFGLPPLVCIDTTHRLVIEGHCCSARPAANPADTWQAM